MTWTYPTDQLDDIQAFTALVGNFWPEIFGGKVNVNDLLHAWQLAERQLFNQTQELGNTLGRTTCPVFHTRDWYELVLLQSQRQNAAPLTYGSGAVYGGGYVYGGTLNASVAYPVDPRIQDAAVITNAIAAPSVTYHRGVEFDLDLVNNRVIFADDPFLNPRIVPEPVFDTYGNVVDQRITLWIFKVKIDWQYLYQQFGYIVGLQPTASSLAYKNLLNAVMDAFTTATSYNAVAQIVEAMTGIPRVKNQGEVVQVIAQDSGQTIIATDQNIYTFVLGVTPIVTVGQVMNQDDQLIDAVQIFEPRNGAVPSFLQQLSLGSGFLLADIANELIFQNKSVPLQVQTNVNGFTKVVWALGGFSADITTFFNDLHSRGVANGATLANYLAPGVPNPGPNNLPSTINPLAFLFQNVLRDNALVVYMRTSQFGPRALGTNFAWILRQVLPPETTIIIFADLTQAQEDVTMNGLGGTMTPGYQEDYSTYSAPGG
jgi:hypothetical protein